MPRARIEGAVFGERVDGDTIVGLVVRATSIQSGDRVVRADCLVLVDRVRERAQYLTWVNAHDVEVARRAEPGRWRVVEQAQQIVVEAEWLPFGWGAAYPSIAKPWVTVCGAREAAATPASAFAP